MTLPQVTLNGHISETIHPIDLKFWIMATKTWQNIWEFFHQILRWWNWKHLLNWGGMTHKRWTVMNAGVETIRYHFCRSAATRRTILWRNTSACGSAMRPAQRGPRGVSRCDSSRVWFDCRRQFLACTARTRYAALYLYFDKTIWLVENVNNAWLHLRWSTSVRHKVIRIAISE